MLNFSFIASLATANSYSSHQTSTVKQNAPQPAHQTLTGRSEALKGPQQAGQ